MDGVEVRDVRRQDRERGTFGMSHVLCEVHIKEVEIEARLHNPSRDRDWVDKVLGKVSTSARERI